MQLQPAPARCDGIQRKVGAVRLKLHAGRGRREQDYQLDWLETKLAAEPNRNTLLLLHHHPLPAGCSWLDQHSLRNSAALDFCLQPVKLIVAQLTVRNAKHLTVEEQNLPLVPRKDTFCR